VRNIKSFISLDHVSIQVRAKVLLEDVSWEILGNQHWAVIGPNGSGKSMLMRALCGSLPVAKGKIVYHFASNGVAREQIGYVAFESQRSVLGSEAFYQERWNVGVNEDNLSAADFLSERSVHSGNPYQIIEGHIDPEFEERKRYVVGQLDVDKLLQRKVVELSNGERRKLTIARALVKNPRLLILDNPFAGLDEHFRRRFAEHLGGLMTGEMRVVIVGTSRDQIPRGITHILSVQEGRVSAQPFRNGQKRENTRSISKWMVNQTDSDNATRRKALVQMKDVNVSYNGTPVLRQVNWTVRENEKWALLGPNGAGKTTLLSLIIADNPQAYANDITLFGKRRGSGESIWEIKQNIGWVAPELQLYYPRSATCIDVVCSGWFDSIGLYHDCSLHQRAVALSWLQQFGLGERADTSFAQLSEGEQRLILLARALVKNPALFVLDEPCQGLDSRNRDRVLEAVDTVGKRSDIGMIYVTHRADELPPSITHVLRLDQGQIVDENRQRD
jgi:molybdate transport system ATP-binding protein